METKEEQVIHVQKLSGELEPFSIDKLSKSLRICGASPEEIDRVIAEIQPVLYHGIPSEEIHKKVFSLLKKTDRIQASKYNLKRAIFDLGPTGFPFERMIGALLRNKGYDVRVGVILQGECVDHEIDVLAERDGNAYAIECKFHSDSRGVSSVKVPLYINSRFLDVQRGWNAAPGQSNHLKQGWLVTNTRFSSDAIRYGSCIGLTLLAWDYPKNNGLEKNIDRFELYPITALTTLNKGEKDLLIERDIILTKEIGQNPGVLKQINMSPNKMKRVLSEVHQLCHL